MLLALVLLASVVDWVPMRWPSTDPESLELLTRTPVNCILLEPSQWSEPLISAAAKRGIITLGVIRPAPDAPEAVRKAMSAKLGGVVLEGDFDDAALGRVRSLVADSKMLAIELPARLKMRFDQTALTGTYQGVWPGIQIDEGGAAKAAPSGAPWINTNSGFLRFVRAAADAPVWIANLPPANTVITGERYLQAICDAAMVGARWVIALDGDFGKRLLSRDPAATKDWKRMTDQLAYFENRKEWREMRPLGQLAIVQDVESGALLSGGVLDMVAVKHTPVRPVPSRKLQLPAMDGTVMAVNVDPSSLSDEQKATLRNFARRGGTVLSGPSSWKFPAPKADQVTLSDDDVKMLDDIWKEVNTMTGRRNLGARLFNVSSMLSNLLEASDGKKAVLHLVNYSGYPVENVTVHLLGKYKKATLLAPGAEAKDISVYEVEEGAGTGVDVDNVNVSATLVFETD